MAFEVISCLSESCTGITIRDITGFFGPEKPFGYNAPSATVPTLTTGGVFGYTTYSAQLFFAKDGGFDPDGTPDYTVNLLTWPSTIDPVTGYVTWEITLEQLGITAARSGWWMMRLTAIWVNNAVTYDYSQDDTFGFTGDLTTKIDATMKRYYAEKGIGCPCDCGGTPILELYQRYRIFRDFTGCVNLYDQFQAEADWLYGHLPLCSC